MTTTMIPPEVALGPVDNLRFVGVRANLLPDEILARRQTERMRKQVLFALTALVALLAAWYGYSWIQTSSSRGDLDDAQRQGTTYRNEQSQFAPLVRAQAEVQSVQLELQRLMVGDLPWKAMLTTLRAQAPRGVLLQTVSGSVTVGTTPTAGPQPANVLNQTGKPAVGQVTLSGTAPDKRTVATYADRLARVAGLTAPFISSFSVAGTTVTFTISVVITTNALGGRYTATSASVPGSPSTSTGAH
jgi:Tfp pilus assembly protein PilN